MTYRTAQKAKLTEFLKQHADTAYTVEELADALSGEHAPGKSTVYRLLPSLVKAGLVKRFVRDGSRTAVYQAVGCSHCDAHLHMKCTDCGVLLHLDDDASTAVLQNVLRDSRFAVDEKQTVLFGRCEHCQKAEAGK